jgi:DNA-binding transcriptional MerR regulator
MTGARAAERGTGRARRTRGGRGGVPGRAARSAREVLAEHHDNAETELYGIAQLVEEFGVSARAIRFYEDKGLLSPRRVNGARVYTRRDRARLALILRAKSIGSSLADVRHYLDLYGARGEGRAQQLRYVLQRTDTAIAELEQRRAQIEATLAELRLINDTVRAQLAARA